MTLTPITAVVADDPYPYYAELVADRPFGFDDGLGLWVAASAAAVNEALTAPGLRVRPPAQQVPAGIVGTPAGDVFSRLVRMTDGPDQRRLKSIVESALGTARVEDVAAVASRRTAHALSSGGTTRDLLFGVPAQVVAVLCGLDDPAPSEASRLIGDFVQCIPASATPEQNAAAASAAAALTGLLGPKLDEHGTGLLAELVRAARADDWPDTAPLLANGLGLLSQTYDATAGLIGNTLVTLARGLARPAPSLGRNRSTARDPDGWPALVREVARFDAPVQNTRRFVAEPVAIAGTPLAAGDAVLVVLAAANRDPAANADPDRFAADRSDPAIYTFGAAAHRCPGETLAVTIAAAVVAEALDQGVSLPVLPVSYVPLANARIPVV